MIFFFKMHSLFCLLILSVKLVCVCKADLINANKLKIIVNSSANWHIEVDREICQSLKSLLSPFSFGELANYALSMIKKFINMKWRFCQFGEIFLVEKEKLLSRCRMIAFHSLVKTNGTLLGNNFYILQVPNTYGINFSVTEFKSVHSGLRTFFAIPVPVYISGCQLVCQVFLSNIYEIFEQFDSGKIMHSYIGIVGFSCYLGYMEAKAKMPSKTLSIMCGVWPFFSLFTDKNCLEIYFTTKSKSYTFVVQGLFQVMNDEKP